MVEIQAEKHFEKHEIEWDPFFIGSYPGGHFFRLKFEATNIGNTPASNVFFFGAIIPVNNPPKRYLW